MFIDFGVPGGPIFRFPCFIFGTKSDRSRLLIGEILLAGASRAPRGRHYSELTSLRIAFDST